MTDEAVRLTLAAVHDDPYLRTNAFVDEFCEELAGSTEPHWNPRTEREQVFERHGNDCGRLIFLMAIQLFRSD